MQSCKTNRMCWVVPNFIQILFINRHAAYDCLFLVWFWSYVDTKLIFQMWTYLKKIFIKYIARRQYQSSLDQINSFREFLAFFGGIHSIASYSGRKSSTTPISSNRTRSLLWRPSSQIEWFTLYRVFPKFYERSCS